MAEIQSITMTIDGKPAGTETFDVLDPAKESVWAKAPRASDSEIDDAFAAADAAFASWAADDGVRSRALNAFADRIEGAVDELSALLTQEQGKSLADAAGEIYGTAAWLRFYADVDFSTVEVVQEDVVGLARYPLGVVAAITPWNYPLILSAWKFAPALRAGNTVVLKPASFTPITVLRIGELSRGILPDGVFNVIAGSGKVGAAMAKHPTTAMVSFTGSIDTGKAIAAAVAPDLKRVKLEMGGNDPAILLDDVDPGAVANDLFWGAFTNNGQVCGAAKRVYAPRAIADAVADALAGVAKSVKVGAGTDDGVQLGPINNAPQFEQVKSMLSSAVDAGASVRSGGKPSAEKGYFLEPTIVADVPEGQPIIEDEQFGPVLPVVAYDDLDSLVAKLNAEKWGLGASVWSSEPDRALGIARGLRVGMIYINGHAINHGPHIPFTGARWSGIGVENGLEGIKEFTQLQVLYTNGAHIA